MPDHQAVPIPSPIHTPHHAPTLSSSSILAMDSSSTGLPSLVTLEGRAEPLTEVREEPFTPGLANYGTMGPVLPAACLVWPSRPEGLQWLKRTKKENTL